MDKLIDLVFQYLKSFLKKATLKNIAAVMGIIEALIPIIREILMLATRICTAFIPGNKDDIAVAKIREWFEKAVNWFKEIKNFFFDPNGWITKKGRLAAFVARHPRLWGLVEKFGIKYLEKKLNEKEEAK